MGDIGDAVEGDELAGDPLPPGVLPFSAFVSRDVVRSPGTEE